MKINGLKCQTVQSILSASQQVKCYQENDICLTEGCSLQDGTESNMIVKGIIVIEVVFAT